MNSKEKIIEQYKALVIQKKSTRIAVKEMCDILQISRTTFYKYFKDTYDILEYIFINDAICYMDALYTANLDVRTITEGWYMSFYKNKEFYCYAIKDDGQNSLFYTIISKLTEYNISLYRNYCDEKDVEYYAYKYASLQAMLLKKWMNEGMVVEPRQMAEYFLCDMLNEHF